MSVLTTKPKFLYPSARQFPIDEVSEKIVRALEKRNWEVPGITVKFDNYGSGEARYKLARTIIGKKFKLHFCRPQGELDSIWTDTAGLYKVCIPKQTIEVFSDVVNPNVFLYAGGINEKKMHLKYKGRYLTQRQNDSTDLKLEKKFNEFTKWLEKNVLGYVLSFEEKQPCSKIDATIEPIPYNGPWNTVYSLCDSHDAERILRGKEDASNLPPEKRHGWIGSGTRLVPLSVENKKRFPDVAYEGFIWCDVDKNGNVTRDSKFVHAVSVYMGEFSGFKNIVSIKLKYANDVYVADNAKFEQKRKQLFEKIAPRTQLTNKELGDVYAARAATMIPITEYKGDYEEPIILIKRELELEEIDKIVRLQNN